MNKINTKPNLTSPDDFYAELIAVHEGLSDEESAGLNARIILLLSNHIGDCDVLSSALNIAKNTTSKS